MKNRNKILLSSIATLMILLSGCTDEEKAIVKAKLEMNGNNISDSNTDSQTGNSDTSTDTGSGTEIGEDDVEDTGSGTDDGSNEKLYQAETVPENWYIRLVAEDKARDLKTQSSQLGELNSDDTADKAVNYVGTSSASYLDIVFEDPANQEAGTYKSVFYTYDKEEEKEWTFSVITDDPNAEITLSWHGLFVLNPKEEDSNKFSEYRSVSNPLIRQMKLVDVQTSEELQAVRDGQMMKYTFEMNGEEVRKFKWVVATSEVSIAVPEIKEKDTVITKTESTVNNTLEQSIERVEIRTIKEKQFDFAKPTMPKFN